MSGRNKNARSREAPRRLKPSPSPGQSGPPRLDATNLAGLTDLMNPQNLRQDANLEAAERTVMGRAGPAPAAKKSAADPIDLYTKELNELAGELGIDFLDGAGGDGANGGKDSDEEDTPRRPALSATPRAPNTKAPRNLLGARSIDALIGDLDLGSDSDDDGGSSADSSDDDGSDDDGSSDGSSDVSSDGSSDESGDEDETDSDVSSDEGSSGSDSDDSVIDRLEKDLGIDIDAARRQSRRRHRVHDVPVSVEGGRSRLSNLTEEQERRRHINAVMGDMRKETRTSFGVEHERVQDEKASKLEQIGQLRMTLEEEGVDCSGVGAPTMDSPVKEIDSVLAILKLKNDRNRYSSLAEEVVLGLAEGVETVFDGTREVPIVGWKPDYTGYHNTVNVKLHRMRFETSQVVGNVIEKYNIGPSARIVMELLPSFFLYPRQQRKQRGSPGLHADFSGGGGGGRNSQVARVSDARSAYSAIRRADVPDSLSSVANI